MMLRKGRSFQRRAGTRQYRKLFIIATEGAETERQYFAIFNNEQSVITVKCLKGGHKSSPPQVLKRMQDRLNRESPKEPYEAWLVVDKDSWTNEQLIQLHKWSEVHDNYGFALSNPKFEYWLLLHFDDGKNILNSQDCSNRLAEYLPNYDKDIDTSKITDKGIADAIKRAKQRDNPPCTDWPRAVGTTVYKLVENILKRKP